MRLSVVKSQANEAARFPLCWTVDPLDEDADDQERIPLTPRQIIRLVLVATETGARFQREGIRIDPMAWMLAPRRTYNGLSPVEACTERHACMSAVLVHGLGLGLNVSASDVEALMSDDETPELAPHMRAVT